jgi:hypothetical protein
LDSLSAENQHEKAHALHDSPIIAGDRRGRRKPGIRTWLLPGGLDSAGYSSVAGRRARKRKTAVSITEDMMNLTHADRQRIRKEMTEDIIAEVRAAIWEELAMRRIPSAVKNWKASMKQSWRILVWSWTLWGSRKCSRKVRCFLT